MDISGSGTHFQNGDIITLNKGTSYFVAIAQWCPINGGWVQLTMSPAPAQITVGPTAQNKTIDNWNIVDDYSPTIEVSCTLATTDSSTRTKNGASVAWPYGGVGPSTAYAGLSNITTNPTERQTQGTNTCTGPGGDGRWRKATGTVTESLSLEDTIDDAIKRAMGIAPWISCVAGCALPSCSAFLTQRGAGQDVFGFAQVQTKGTWTAVIGQTYKVTIRFASRILGTGGPFIFYGLTEVTVVADAISEETAWIDVPCEPGLEVIAANCDVVLLP